MAWDPALLQPHGTTAAYRRHHRLGEKPCEPCRQAEARRRPVLDAAQRHARYLATRPVPVVHYGRHRPPCGRQSRYGLTLTTSPGEVTCQLCKVTLAFRDALEVAAE